ncbi:MAG TPA: ABC transporter permease [Erysipelotrichaceae bacterium]|nr:ABC transporter permease [Erysipelotrichaceae bacterium]
MKTLLKFAFKRRFLNKMTIILQVLFILIVCTVFYMDKISEFFNLDFHQPIEIKIENTLRKEIKNEDEWKSQGFVFTNNSDSIEISKVDNVYQICNVQELSIQQRIYDLLLRNHKRSLENENNLDWLEKYNTIHVEFIDSKLDENTFKQQIIILFLTSIYFMMLNFIAVNSNEIIMEKTSHMIPIILSSVKIRIHFLTKLIIGFCSVLFQIISSIGIVGLIGFLRYKLDQGQGLIRLILKFLPIQIDDFNITELFKLLDFKTSDFYLVLLGLLFILLGIFLIQICILILSSKVKTMEEAASIQGPFYLILLIIYYLALSLNTTHALSSGLGYILSFVPIFSMLIMPMRLLTSHVMPIELVVSILFTIALISLIFIVLYPQYESGLKNER